MGVKNEKEEEERKVGGGGGGGQTQLPSLAGGHLHILVSPWPLWSGET